MKPNKDIDFNKFVEWSENLCNKRHDKLVELRKKKAGNNLQQIKIENIKFWYLIEEQKKKY